VTDHDLDQAIEHAVREPDGHGLAALLALRDRLTAERGPVDPALARTWDAIVEVAGQAPDGAVAALPLAEERARWLAAAHGAAHPAVLRAWVDLGEAAEQEFAWPVATRAWQAIVDAPTAAADPATLAAQSLALRGLGARRLAAGDPAGARALFERDVAVTERLRGAAHPQLALSLGNLAVAAARLDDRAGALAARRRQRDALAASGAAPSQLAAVDRELALLG
jgi:hypothetical protein